MPEWFIPEQYIEKYKGQIISVHRDRKSEEVQFKTCRERLPNRLAQLLKENKPRMPYGGAESLSSPTGVSPECLAQMEWRVFPAFPFL